MTRSPSPASVTDVADYYDRNTSRFLLMGGGAPSMHRALWATGTASARDAAAHVDRLLAAAVDGFALGSAPSIVDFGCGVGGTLFHLAEHLPSAALTGVTVSRRQVEAATRMARDRGLQSRCRIMLGDFQTIELETPAEVIVAVESFVHSASPDAFLASAARNLGSAGHLIVVDDFLAGEETTLGTSARARVEEFRAGWRIPALGTVEELAGAAARHGFSLRASDDLTPLTRPGSRLRDRITAAASPLLARLGLARMPFYGNIIGGNALQIGLREGFLRYCMLIFLKTGGEGGADAGRSAGRSTG
jgi:cyclopropane fatty-acyl-phospholipid synthase-like methyltransferase